MRTVRDMLVSFILALVVVVALVYLSLAEMNRREAIAETLTRMNNFMNSGERFPLQYGMSNCERIYRIEIKLQMPNPADCDGIRNAITISSHDKKATNTQSKGVK